MNRCKTDNNNIINNATSTTMGIKHGAKAPMIPSLSPTPLIFIFSFLPLPIPNN
jgi:hypothetical protein